MLINKLGYSIPLDDLTEPKLKELKQILTVKPQVLEAYDYGQVKSFTMYRLSEKKIYIPKFFGIDKYGIAKRCYKSNGLDMVREFKGDLLPHQVDYCKLLLNEILENDSCIAQSGTGSGKTFMALWLSSQLKARTLILVHKEFLANQWSDRIKQYLPDATIGFIQQDKCEIECDFVIGMIQTIISRDLPTKLFDNIRFVAFDECFTPDQLIITDKGPVAIGTLYNVYNGTFNVNLPENLRILPKVLSYNTKDNILEYKNITYAWERKNENILNISYGRGKIKCTENHKILTCSGYIEANKLKVGDLIKCNYVPCEQNPIAQDLNSDQYQILLGSFLGDGNVQVLPAGRFRLRVIHGEKQHDYCEWKSQMFNCDLQKIENNGYAKGVAYRFTTRIIDSDKQFPIQKSTCPQWILDDMDYRGLAIWWMDDGHLCKETGGTLSTCSFDEDSHIRIICKLKNMEISDVGYREDGHGYLTIYFGKRGIYELLTKIRKYLHPSMKYKFYNKHLIDANIEYNTGDIPNEENLEFYVWNNKFSDFGTIKIKSIERVKNSDIRSRVYDLEVEDNHNFVLSTGIANMCGPIVHNCHHIAAASFSQTLFKCNARYSIGLSATPTRKDGLTKILEWSLGKILSNEVFSDIETPIVEFISAEYSTKIIPKFNFRAQLNAPNLINQLVVDPKRNEQIVDKIISLNNDGRKILILSGRREHCINLNKLTLLKNTSLKTGIYMGSMKTEDLEKSNLADIIFATYSAVSEAYDNKKLDTLIMATGMGDVTQSIGRILRCKNINRPLVVDVTDKEFFMGQSRKRVAFYKKSNYLIKGFKKEVEVKSEEKFMFVD